jgi:hypothetical protein
MLLPKGNNAYAKLLRTGKCTVFKLFISNYGLQVQYALVAQSPIQNNINVNGSERETENMEINALAPEKDFRAS